MGSHGGEAESINRFVQGTVWRWEPRNEVFVEGVQSGERPVIIISNDTFNQFSPSVNCLTITSVLKDSPVHVPINVEIYSHIQCEQIHTIAKSELTLYKGAVSPATMSAVKAKLKVQFDITERNTELLMGIKKGMDEVSKIAKSGFGLPDIEKQMAQVLSNVHNNFVEIKADLAELLTSRGEPSAEKSVAVAEAAKPSLNAPAVSKSKPGQRHSKYTVEDKRFIIDANNSLESLVERFGYKDKPSASKMRAYFRKKFQEPETTTTPTKPVAKGRGTKRPRRNLTDEQILFLVDRANSVETLMATLGFPTRKDANTARSYYTRRLNAKTA